MAETSAEEGPLKQGSVLPVTIEQAIADTLVVCLSHGAKIYRGILLDANKMEMPYGLGFQRLDLEAARRIEDSKTTVEVTPTLPEQINTGTKHGNTDKVEVSALSFRHSYSLDPNSTDPKLIPPPRRTISKPIRDKNIRNMRLRPRQVLCSKCKQGIHDTNVQSTSKSVSGPNAENTSDSTSKVDVRRKKAANEVPDSVPNKVQKVEDERDDKSLPIIKISFTSPEGEGTVLQIPKKNTASNTCVDQADPNEIDVSSISHENYKKLKKALKRARLKEKMKAGQESVVQNTSDKKNKRNKKDKRRNRDETDSLSHGGCAPCSISVTPKDTENSVPEVGPRGFASRNNNGPGGASPSFPEQHGLRELENSCENISQEWPHLSPARCLNIDVHDFESSQMSNSSMSGSSSKEVLGDSDVIGASHDQSDTENDISSILPPQDSGNVSPVRPLMMRIQTKNVPKCAIMDGRTLCRGDVVWGKIHGFPWWPGKIISITISQRDNGVVITQTAHVSWFGSSTMSHMPCAELYPFLEDFKLRYNKKKKGPYKIAIKQATIAAHNMLNNTDFDVKYESNQSEVIDVLEA